MSYNINCIKAGVTNTTRGVNTISVPKVMDAFAIC